ncbi:MAG: ABC transporter permease [Candidatus Nanopelagicales bacterium]|nr:ABC transporter permease [Actinomycetota bacterium]HNL51877.1 ABC transporter permease [Actinomycetota bacterium]HNO16182.1 ABC transporter permease [Actinomycetota bacterium]
MSLIQDVAGSGGPDPIPGPPPLPRKEKGSRGLSPGATFALRKTGAALGTLFFVLVVNFFLFRLLPGDPIGMYTRGRNVPPEQLAELRAELNRPVLEQFLTYLRNPFASTIDSAQFNRPVWELVTERIWPTLLLVGTAIVLASIIGVWIGIKAGWKRGKSFDKVSTGVTLTLYSMPEFWLGMILLIIFGVGAFGLPGMFPIGGISSPGVDTSSLAGWLDVAWHMVLPVTTLTLVYLAEYALVMRSSLVDEMDEDYLTTARAKGLMDRLVRRRHAVPNALLPTVTLIFLNLGFTVSGAITVETVFSWPGLGLLSYEALRGPDVALLQAIFLLFSIGVVLANLVADLLYAVIDPRVRS